MHSRGIIFLLLATLLAGNVPGNAQGNAEGNVTTIPASQDVYISMGENRVSVYNQTEILLCAINVTGYNESRMISYPGAPVVQFNISSLNITDSDVAILVLKAASMKAQGDPVMVALMSIGSDWDESSDYTTFLVNILPAWNIIKKNDATAMSSNTDGDRIFAFDVSQKLRDARAKGDKISFLLEAISTSSSEIAFLSKETGQGPCLVIMPYPASTPDVTMQPDSALQLNSSLQIDNTTILSENVSLTEKQIQQTGGQIALAEIPQTDSAGSEVPVEAKLQDNQSIEKKMVFPIE